MPKNVLWIGLAVLGILVVGLVWVYWPERDEAPEAIARLALQAPDARNQLEAVSKLAALAAIHGRTEKQNGYREQLGRVFKESTNPQVRAACAAGFAQLADYDRMPALLDALADESTDVRAAAGQAVERMMNVSRGFNADDPPERRSVTVKLLRDDWEAFTRENKVPK
jgi:hypothetical protein